MSTKIYLIRHAEAEGNLFRVAHGQYNSTLTPRGYRQLRYLRDRFRDIHIDAVYGSDLLRAHATASAISDKRRLLSEVRPPAEYTWQRASAAESGLAGFTVRPA